MPEKEFPSLDWGILGQNTVELDLFGRVLVCRTLTSLQLLQGHLEHAGL